MTNDNRNMILAVVLSALVLFGWGLVTESFFPTANPPVTKTVDGKQVPVAPPQASPPAAAARPTRARNLVLAETSAQRIPIRTPRLAGSLNLAGARIDDLVLTTHREGIAANSPPIRLFSPEGTPGAYYGSFGWNRQEGVTPAPDAVWQVSAATPGARLELTPSTPVTLSWTNSQGQLFEIQLSVDDGYLFTARQRVTNRGAAPVAVVANAFVNRVGVSHDPTSWTSHVGPVAVLNGAANYDNDFLTVAQAQNGTLTYTSHGGWLGFTDKYWLAAIVPAQAADVTASFRHLAGDAYQADFATPMQVAPNAWQRTTSHLFAGAKEIALLDRYTAELGTDMGRAIDWGWFDFIMKPIFALLTWLFFQLGNFGVAIIFLVIIVRLILFPLAQKQFASMAKMKVVQPKVKALQERHAADKPRLQQEMMKLYKEEKVNPMAGCLPIFLQIPVFYALYKVLMVSVEMRHQPFVLWIKDLTAPDPLTPVNLFGFLPFTPPGILAIGILPIMVGVTMWIQQKLNTAPMDPTQQKIFAFMPWILVVIMAPFAAGFQVYWVTNNLISILQIWFLNRKMGAQAARPAVAVAAVAPPKSRSPKGRSRPRRK